jgi:hypothetical protein
MREAERRLLKAAQRNTTDLERSQQTVDRYAAEWEQTGAIASDEVQPALLAFADHAATATEGARAAFATARAFIGLLREATIVSDDEIEARARLLVLARQLRASASTPLTAHARSRSWGAIAFVVCTIRRRRILLSIISGTSVVGRPAAWRVVVRPNGRYDARVKFGACGNNFRLIASRTRIERTLERQGIPVARLECLLSQVGGAGGMLVQVVEHRCSIGPIE